MPPSPHIHKSHQPSGLRWFRFKTLPIFQLGGFTLPPTPFPGCGSRGPRGGIGSIFGARFEPPFFHHLGPPQIVITNYFGSKTSPFGGSKRVSKQASGSGFVFFGPASGRNIFLVLGRLVKFGITGVTTETKVICQIGRQRDEPEFAWMVHSSLIR